MSDVITIYTDGACRGNPGPGGWAAFLVYGDHNKKILGAESHTTNNRMELTAAINALKAIKHKNCNIMVITDSIYLKNGITTWIKTWKLHNWKNSNRKEVKNIDLWKILDELIQMHQIQWRWVKAHAGHKENELVDKLANEAIDQMLAKGI